jgi:putative N6-adenine-specific DNA methylase
MQPLSPNALERRLKRHFMKETHSYFAVCALGFEDVLEKELKNLRQGDNLRQEDKETRGQGEESSPLLPVSLSPLLTITGKEPGGVSFTAPLTAMYHTNLRLRSAHRVLLRIDDFLAQSYPMLFNKALKVPWELYLSKDYTLQVSSKTSRLHQQKNIAKTLQDAITKRLEPLGITPKLNENAPLEIHVRLFQDRCTLSINTSGEHLHKRGYRQLVSEAPIRETLAASLLLGLNWHEDDLTVDPVLFVDPVLVVDLMCGSGTFPIEAALLGQNLAPGLNRSFAFEHLPGFQKSKWERFKREAKEQARDSKTTYLGFDIDPKNIAIAQENAAKAGVKVDVSVADATVLNISKLSIPKQGKVLLVSNLPYGERLDDGVLEAFAKNLKKHFAGWSFAFVCKDTRWLKGFKIQQTQAFENGGIKVVWVTGIV